MIQPALSDAQGAPGMQPQEALHDCLLDATQACLGGQWERALALVDVALASYPDDGELLHLKGLSLLRAGQRESAIHCFRRAAHFRPGVAQIHFDLAAVCAELSRCVEAMVHYRHCLRIEPTHCEALWNFGEMLRTRERFDEAARCFEAIEAQDREHDRLDLRLACAQFGMGNLSCAARGFERELARVRIDSPSERRAHPGSAMVHWEYAHLLLTVGDFERGFESYEHRFAVDERGGVRCAGFDAPRWRGEALAGKALLVHGEQGIGDEIMFASLVPALLREIGLSGRLVLAVSQPLVRLFGLAWPEVTVLPHSPQAPASGPWLDGLDFETPIGSLARWRMPADGSLRTQPPYLHAPEYERANMRARLAALAPRSEETLKVGLAWAGGAAHRGAKASGRDRGTSISLAEFAPLAELTGVTFVSLQNQDVALEAAHAAFDLVDCHEVLSDMACTAALLAEMDVIVSIDAPAAHLAAAMGAAPWVLLAERPDWRWGVDEGACVWYPELTQLRQLEQGDWRPVIADLHERLAVRRSHLKRSGRP